MNFTKLIVTVAITCAGQRAIIEDVDVIVMGGRFHSGSVITVVKENHPGCDVAIINVQWVVNTTP